MGGVAADLEDRLKALMLRGQAGDAAAWRELLSALSRQLRGYFARRLDAGAPIGLTRSFKLFGNGTVRVADCDPLLVGVPCR